MTLSDLCMRLETEIPTARAKMVIEMSQIIVSFTSRPDVEVALLTPYFQTKAKKLCLESDDVEDLIMSVRRIANGY